MKVAWFTPLSRKTGIAKYSVAALEALSEFFDIDVWTEKKSDDYSLEGDIPVYEINIDSSFFNKLEAYDFIVYNMGNNIDFHEKIYEVYKKKKGVVIIHDKVMHCFFAALYLDRYKNEYLYKAVMKNFYDKDGELAANNLNGKLLWETEDVVKFPLVEQCLWNATGVITLSKESLEFVRKNSPVPSVIINYPFSKEQTAIRQSRRELELPEKKFIIIQSGHVVANKNSHKVLEAITSDSELRESVFFVIAGNDDNTYAQGIKEMVAKSDLSDKVLFTGYIEDAKLYDFIGNSDLCVNLRYPSTEGASWSVIEQMHFGKPVLATRIGFFAEIPDDCVMKVDPPINIDELRICIKKFLHDNALRASIALNARNFVLQNFSKEKFAEDFLKFVEKVQDSKEILGFVDKISDEASLFLDPDKVDYLIEKVCRELTFLNSNSN